MELGDGFHSGTRRGHHSCKDTSCCVWSQGLFGTLLPWQWWWHLYLGISLSTHTCWDTQSTNWTVITTANYPTMNLVCISVTMQIHILTMYPRNWYIVILSQNMMLEAESFMLLVLAWATCKMWRSWQLTHPRTSSSIPYRSWLDRRPGRPGILHTYTSPHTHSHTE